MRPILLAAACIACVALPACSTTDSGPSGSGLGASFDPSNYRRTDNTNGTQTRPDVNRTYTQPVLPSITNRGF